MNQIEIWQAIVLGVVEGLTEFLPISSTGHLILAAKAIGLDKSMIDIFTMFIQIGAILAVCVYYRQKIGQITAGLLQKQKSSWRLFINISLATMPAIILGLTCGKFFKQHLFNTPSISVALIIGGLIILWAEMRQKRKHQAQILNQISLQAIKNPNLNKNLNKNQIEQTPQNLEDISTALALKIGLCQTLALIPGTSRSGATIIGGLFLGMPRQLATEFSFFLGIPLLFGAGLYDLYKNIHLLTPDILIGLSIGFVVSFIVAFFCIHALLKFVAKNSFTAFAYYRIIFGVLLLILWKYNIL